MVGFMLPHFPYKVSREYFDMYEGRPIPEPRSPPDGKRFVFSGSLGYIDFNLDDFDGNVASAIVAVEHRTWNYFGFGLGYSYTGYDIDTLSTDFLGKWEYTVSGFEIYARAAW